MANLSEDNVTAEVEMWDMDDSVPADRRGDEKSEMDIEQVDRRKENEVLGDAYNKGTQLKSKIRKKEKNRSKHKSDKIQQKKKKKVSCRGQLSSCKKKRAKEHGKKRVQHTTLSTDDEGFICALVEMKGIEEDTTWQNYCNLPVLKSDGQWKINSEHGIRVVSIQDKMVYCGPLNKDQRQLLSFKVAVMCHIVKDPHSPQFCVSGNMLQYPLCNPSLVAMTETGDVQELGKAIDLIGQSKSALSNISSSVLTHCMLRYILDVGETGLYNLVLQLETRNWLNCRLNKSWGETNNNCHDRIVRFFEARKPHEAKILVIRCMVLANKATLLVFLEELDMSAVDQAMQLYGIPSSFVFGMRERMEHIRSVLSTFEAKDLISF